MKYSYNNNEWMEEIRGGSKICKDVINFNVNTFNAFMKRKTLSDTDLQALENLFEMVEMMKAHAEDLSRQ